jgi:hypothetical protein
MVLYGDIDHLVKTSHLCCFVSHYIVAIGVNRDHLVSDNKKSAAGFGDLRIFTLEGYCTVLLVELGIDDNHPAGSFGYYIVLVDISEVRSKAKEARDAGVKLPEVWKAFGSTKLSDVPAAKYNGLMDLLDSKMKEIGG